MTDLGHESEQKNIKIAAKIINFDNDSNPPMSAIHEGNIFIMFNSNKVALFEGSLFSNWINVISSLSASLSLYISKRTIPIPM